MFVFYRFLLGLLLLAALQQAAWAEEKKTYQGVHVAFLTDCTMYSDWQSVGMAFSFRMSGQPGDVIRVMCCSEKDRKRYSKGLLEMVETWIAPDMSVSPRNNDRYAAYNKPEAVLDWLDYNTPKHDYVLVLDSDMILRRPFLVEWMTPRKGLAVGARYTYMIGVNNELAVRHIPHVAPRNDTLAGPYGRRADQVGGFFFIHKDDLKAMSHDWLKFSEDVRMDDQAYRLSGDVYATHPGDRPWISEMYGYAFGAANHDVWHKWDIFSMIYPGYEPRDGIPKLIHYGLLFEIGKEFSFDKHWHYDFDVTACPPWDLTDPKHRKHGIFPPPPHPSTINQKQDFISIYRDLISIETVAMLNAAFCDYHIKHCPASEQLVTVCREVFKLFNEARAYVVEAEKQYDCQDFHPKCGEWKTTGECEKNPGYMEENCARTCGKCKKVDKFFPETTTKEFEEKLDKMAAELQPLTADPDAKKADSGGAPKEKDPAPTIIPKVDTPIQVVPRNTEPPKVASPPPKSPSPPPPETPSSPPPEESPSPPPRSPHPKHIAHEAKDKSAAEKEKRKTQKELMVRCYKMSLVLDEVTECVKEARAGRQYNPKPTTTASTDDDSGEQVGPKKTKESSSEEDDSKLHSSSDSDSEDTLDKSRVLKEDQEDLTLHTKKVVSPNLDAPVVGPSLHSLVGRLGTWQALVLWLLVVLAFLAIVPRIAKLRRRQRSGMRTE